jgi:hypothetical protein
MARTGARGAGVASSCTALICTALITGVLLGLGGCAVSSGRSVAARPPASPATPAGPRDELEASALPYPTDDPRSVQAALDTATTVMTAFARPDQTADAWWTALSPLLTPAAATAYSGTDPAEIPASTVTGPAWLGESRSPFLATVFVPTDAGNYVVLLVREDAAAPWLAERITQAGS